MANLIIVAGAAGRMGRLLVALGSRDPQHKVVGALEAHGNSALGSDATAIDNLAGWLTGNTHDAEDITQEAFLQIYRTRARYEPRAAFSTRASTNSRSESRFM